MSPMLTDILLQVILLLVTLTTFLSLFNIPQTLFRNFLLHRSRHVIQSKQHFVNGAQLLNRAKLQNSKSLAKQAVAEAETAIALTPNDAALHILKALALDFQGFTTSAIESFDVALSPLAAGSLSKGERGDALVRRAEMRMRGKGGRRRLERGAVEGVVRDLKEAVELGREDGKVFCLLGECYEVLKMRDEARVAYGEAVRVDEGMAAAKEALLRLNGGGSS